MTDPVSVLLIGIAGSYTERFVIGSATQFGQVGCYGVGVGEGEHFQPANQMGWSHFDAADKKIGDRIDLQADHDDPMLLTCMAASQSVADVRLRLSVFEDAVAEDMEGFAMAMACELANVKHRFIVRGISNRAGDRDKENWQIDTALASACQLAELVVAAHDQETGVR